VRIALIGAGRIGQLHGRLVAEQEGIDEVVVTDVDAGRATSLATEIGGRYAVDPEAAFEGADAVIVASSTDAHATLVRAAVDHRLPVFCEKPLAFDLEETIALVEYIERAGAMVHVGFQRRFDPAYVEARGRVERGELGTIYMVRLIAHDHEPPPEDYIPRSGGLFRDSSIHDFDAIRWMTGVEVAEVYAIGSVRGFPMFAKYDDVDTAAVILTLVDGTIGILGQTRHDPIGYDIRMEVIGSKDSVAMGLGPRAPIRSTEPGAPEPTEPWSTFLTRFETAYRAELLAFLQVVRGELPSPCSAREASEAMRIAIAAGRSRKEGRAVRLSEIAEATRR
jgi:myo-inositol 2-dehydrogenase / D-chiro-inositol 1-dehydrogenase